MIRLLATLGCVALLAGCGFGDDSPASVAPSAAQPATAPLSYDYLTKLPLNVSEIVIDDSWTPQEGSGTHVEDGADPRPIEALARMARDRITASGGAGQAVVTIADASLVRAPGQLVGSFSVRITMEGADPPPPPVVASVSGTRTLSSDAGEQATAATLVRQLMDKMNVELEYQIRHQLADHSGGPPDAVPSSVQTEDLAAPKP